MQQTLSRSALQEDYRARSTPAEMVRRVHAAVMADCKRNAWIHLAEPEELSRAAHDIACRLRNGATLPLYGLPFGVKDNIDVAGMPTTAACPDFSYIPERSARSVELLLEAGAICIGKTNLDQFATGLCGVRSPYGACSSVYHPDYVSGGSSSGSAVAVAAGHVTFALGTDTGGSGRIPAGFNNIVGVKPTVGRLSARGLVPNCPSIDCVSIFAQSINDARAVFDVLDKFDPDDPFARPKPTPTSKGDERRFSFGRLTDDALETFGHDECAAVYQDACRTLEDIGGEPHDIDFRVFMDCGAMLFDGAWIAERRSSIAEFSSHHPGALLPIIETVVAAGQRFSGADVFQAQRQLAQMKCVFEQNFGHLTTIVVPTAPRPFTLKELEENPVDANNKLGHYSYAANLLDLCATAVPNRILSSGVPMGITFLGKAWSDETITALADRFVKQRAFVPIDL